MTERELRKLSRRELEELFLAQEKNNEASKRSLEDLEQENRILKESLTRIGKTLTQLRERETAAAAALAEKDAALQNMEKMLAVVETDRADRDRLEDQVDRLFESFRQIRPILQEKDRQLQTAERRIAKQEETIQILQERLGIHDRG